MIVAEAVFVYTLIAVGVYIGLISRGQPRVAAGLVALVWPSFLLMRVGIWIGE